jgi:hypothetical protein
MAASNRISGFKPVQVQKTTGIPLYPFLSRIYTALQEHRGYKDFVRSPTMPNCDFWGLFASEFEWCSLKPESARDVETFRQILAERANFRKLEFSDDSSPILARVIIDGPWRGDNPTAQRLLEDICKHWPEGKKIHCLTTCGAFLRFDWPTNIEEQGDNRFGSGNHADSGKRR